MAESIRSREILGRASMESSPRPRHTAEGHADCAYYLVNGVDAGESMAECSHGEAAGGAFYNEDYVWELRQLSHQIIEQLDRLLHPVMRISPTDKDFAREMDREKHSIAPRLLLGFVERNDIQYLGDLTEDLRRLTK